MIRPGLNFRTLEPHEIVGDDDWIFFSYVGCFIHPQHPGRPAGYGNTFWRRTPPWEESEWFKQWLTLAKNSQNNC